MEETLTYYQEITCTFPVKEL